MGHLTNKEGGCNGSLNLVLGHDGCAKGKSNSVFVEPLFMFDEKASFSLFWRAGNILVTNYLSVRWDYDVVRQSLVVVGFVKCENS